MAKQLREWIPGLAFYAVGTIPLALMIVLIFQ